MIVNKEICDKLNDEKLVRFSLKEIDYFLCIYERYRLRLLRYILKITLVSIEEAEDILQEAFIKVWQNLKSYNPKLKLRNWLYRIVHNETITYWRKSQSFSKNKKLPFIENLGYTEQDAMREAREMECAEKHVHELMNCLSFKYKSILFLKYFEGMNYQDISDVLKIPEGTVATRLNRAKKQFAQLAQEKEVSFEL